MRITPTHVYFWRGPFSNWEPVRIKDSNAGKSFANTEQCYMYYKAAYFDDVESAKAIAIEKDPQKAKKLGRAVKGFNEPEWDKVKFAFMIYANILKFNQNEKFKKELLNTGNLILVEASPYDKIWGVGLREEDDLILDEKNWQGQNLLGKALMEVRKTL